MRWKILTLARRIVGQTLKSDHLKSISWALKWQGCRRKGQDCVVRTRKWAKMRMKTENSKLSETVGESSGQLRHAPTSFPKGSEQNVTKKSQKVSGLRIVFRRMKMKSLTFGTAFKKITKEQRKHQIGKSCGFPQTLVYVSAHWRSKYFLWRLEIFTYSCGLEVTSETAESCRWPIELKRSLRTLALEA